MKIVRIIKNTFEVLVLIVFACIHVFVCLLLLFMTYSESEKITGIERKVDKCIFHRNHSLSEIMMPAK